ncbi:acyl-CoA dehydrogenase family protein [Ideonella sp. B7]|uniref:acyl-CoA dehydrogenase family protein n=1 Tax=Ideonella benzenivorans TaxID=2831643 RepID=UPI001CEC4862|nr:acyl-CoA dehydrogenase family protein [Ideonella benzenivorans]MCA6215998.1 acyl-CoA dehydrogenase family protein [Ideonella benzenivorans]
MSHDLDVQAVTAQLAERLAATAVARDRRGGHAAAERDAIRNSGLLGLVIPKDAGGLGAAWSTQYQVLRRLAQVDSALTHVYAFHNLQIATIQLWGSAAQQADLLPRTLREHWFWGNALNPRDTRLKATRVEGGWVLNGVKSYASGSVGSDRLVLSAVEVQPDGSERQLVGHVATRAAGVQVQEDWDSFGQRQTDSGTVTFEQVPLPDAAVFQRPGETPTPQATLRTVLAQLILTNLYLGLAQGAYQQALGYLRERTRPWPNGNAAQAIEEPLLAHRWAELWLKIRAAELATDAAQQAADVALARGAALTAEERGAVAIAAAEAKVLAHRAGVDVSSEVFELTGPGATQGGLGLDRFWRNVRVHTLHDPVDLKLRDIGHFHLQGRVPAPTSYT